MEPEIQRACIRAAAKLVFGLSIVAALIGIRMVSVAPGGMGEAEDKLAALDAELEAEAGTRPVTKADPFDGNEADASDGSVFSRIGRALPGQGAGADAKPDPMVTCRISGRTQFTRASECAMRGGRSTVVELER